MKHKNRSKKLRYLKIASLATLAILILLIIFSTIVMWRFARLTAQEKEVIGISFSQVQSERFGQDWRKNYEAILDDLKPRHIRIATYWDRIEKEPGKYDFSETDWMIEQARAHNTRVTLVVGQKVIRWPECFYPAWLDKNNPGEAAPATTKFIKATAEHYKDNLGLTNWQLENEFFLKVFGECPRQNLTHTQLQNEYDVLKSIDGNRPIVLSASNNYGLPLTGPFGGIYGFSMYKRVWNPQFGYFVYTYPAAWSWWRAGMINLFLNQNIRIHELQAEAWGPTGNEKLSYEESTKSMNPRYFDEIISWARATNIKHFDLWGSEWWYDQKTRHGHSEMWEAVKKIIHDSNTTE